MFARNYYRDTIGQEYIYRCCTCAHDTFDERAAIGHQGRHGNILLPGHGISINHWVLDVRVRVQPRGNVVIGILTCNDGHAAVKSLIAAESECSRLSTLGYEASIVWVDNGTEGFEYRVLALDRQVANFKAIRNPHNMGQSYARNQIIEQCILNLADWLIMVDGDITLIPYSGHALISGARYDKVECLGLFSANCSDQDDIDHECRSTRGLTEPNTDMIAWTQYGAFDCQIFRNGLRFDESAPFQGPGWGFEDDDFGLQMAEKDYKISVTKHFRYGHYRRHSSLRRLDPVLAAKTYEARKSFVYNKWRNHKNYSIAKAAAYLNNQTMPVIS